MIHTGQNYDYKLNGVTESLGIREPDHFSGAAGETAAETIANVIVKSDKILREVKPDAVLILGDTNSCLAAISAKRGSRFQSFTWRPAIGASTSACRRLTAGSWTSRPMSTFPTAPFPGTISSARDSRPTALSKREARCSGSQPLDGQNIEL